MNRETIIKNLQKEWRTNPRWKGVTRPYSAKEVLKLAVVIVLNTALPVVEPLFFGINLILNHVFPPWEH
jgi:isocitrate lyase